MDWIKRNLVFVIGAAVALALMGLAGWYGFSGWQNSAGQTTKLSEGYTELKRLKEQKPSPGEGKVNNIENAREQQKEARAFLAKLATRLQPIPALPEGTNVASKDYKSVLQDTISDLQREAANTSVIVPPRYNFSFEKQAGLVKFADGTLQPLATQLGEVKAICDVLIEAKVNALEGIRRERVPGSPDDMTGTPTDYLDLASTTNELAIITPYEITIRCFTPELAGVLAGFARSPYGLVVKAINSDPAPASLATDAAAVAPVYYTPPPVAQPAPVRRMAEEGAAMASRYGVGGTGYKAPYAQTAPVAVPMAQPAGVPAARSGLQPFLKEKQLRVTMLIHVVKLLPQQN
jgi:hypothetical protein